MIRFPLFALLIIAFCRPLAVSAPDVVWLTDYETARREAAKQKRPLILDFGTQACFWCKKLDATTFRDPGVIKVLAERFVVAKLDGEKDTALVQSLGIQSYPTLVFLNAEGKVLGKHVGYVEVARFQQQLERALRESGTVAPRADSAKDRAALEARLAEIYLSEAGTALEQGRQLEAVTYLERIQYAFPDSPQALAARETLVRLKPSKPIIRAQSP